MTDTDELLRAIRQWVEKSEHDLRNAVHTLDLRSDCPTDTVCFHAQQCAEKYLKALLASEGKNVPRNHDIGELTRCLAPARRSDLSVEEQETLSDYAVSTRYPGDYGAISVAEARRAVAMARRVRKHVRALLPLGALPRSRARS